MGFLRRLQPIFLMHRRKDDESLNKLPPIRKQILQIPFGAILGRFLCGSISAVKVIFRCWPPWPLKTKFFHRLKFCVILSLWLKFGTILLAGSRENCLQSHKLSREHKEYFIFRLYDLILPKPLSDIAIDDRLHLFGQLVH